jgi:hypothetical protein
MGGSTEAADTMRVCVKQLYADKENSQKNNSIFVAHCFKIYDTAFQYVHNEKLQKCAYNFVTSVYLSICPHVTI